MVADQAALHSLDRLVIEMQSGRHDEIVLGDLLPRAGHDAVAVRIEFGDIGTHPIDIARQKALGRIDHLAFIPNT